MLESFSLKSLSKNRKTWLSSPVYSIWKILLLVLYLMSRFIGYGT